MSQASLTALMNSMINHLDDILPEDTKNHIPEERYWHMIGLYLTVDPVLARLYKQYCEAKDHLGKMLASSEANSPMAEVAWDMHDSLRSAIDTRLIELREMPDIKDRIEKARQNEDKKDNEVSEKLREEAKSLHNIMSFLVWTSLVFKDLQNRQDLARKFAKAS